MLKIWRRWCVVIVFALVCSASFGLSTVSILGLLFWIWAICSLGQNFHIQGKEAGRGNIERTNKGSE